MRSEALLDGLYGPLFTTAVIWLAYLVLRALYNVFLHPLRSFPGPRLAAATYLPELYYDVICTGRYTREIRRMHEIYGPIIRINPDELHCSDPSFVDEIYAVGGRKRDKPIHQMNATVNPGSSFGTVEHDLHRARRVPAARFFTRSMVARLEGEIAALTQKLCDKILAQGPEPLDVAAAYSNLTTDVISGYCFGEQFGLLTQNSWKPNFRDPTVATLRHIFIFRFFPFVKSLMILGTWLVDYLPEETALLVRTMQVDIPNLVRKAIADQDAGIVYERPTVVGSILDSELSAEEKRLARISQDVLAIMSAGTETTSWALAVITYHLLTKPDVLRKLTEELRGAIDDPQRLPSWTALEKLPYLGGVIQEGLRLSYGVATRTARIATDEDLVYRGEWKKKPVEYLIPRGYAVGMSTLVSHHNEQLFPNSDEFRPERWLDVDAQGRRELDRSMLSFSKGSRACMGMHLALCELHLTLAALTLRVFPHMQLYETTEDDVRHDYDLFIPMTKKTSKGVRAIIV